MFRSVALVSEQHQLALSRRVSVHLAEPVRHIVKRGPRSNVVDNDDAICPSVVRRGDGLEPLHPCRVPHHEFHNLAIDFDGAEPKVNPDRGDEGAGETVVRESQQQARFADTGVSNQDELYHVVVRSWTV